MQVGMHPTTFGAFVLLGGFVSPWRRKMIATDPLHYKEVLEKLKLRKDGKPKQSGRKVRKPYK
jgi:hypothetical protein